MIKKTHILLGIMFLFFPLVYAIPPTDNIVSVHPFDDATTSGSTTGDVVNSNDGTITNAVTGTTGKLSECYTFDGTEDYITVTDDPYDATLAEGSIVMWIKPDVVSGTYALAEKGQTASLAHAWLVYIESGILRFYYSDATGANVISSASSLAVGSWQLIGVSWSNADANATVFINGTYDNSGMLTKSPTSNAYNFLISKSTSITNEFDGLIDEVVVHSDFLELEEHLEYWNGGSGYAYPYASGSNIVVVDIDYPENNTGINGVDYPLRINGTVRCNEGVSNITINMTGWGMEWNWTDTSNEYIFFNYTRASLSDGYYTVNVTANDTDGNENSTLIYFTVDATNPILSVTAPINNSWYSDTVTITATCSDANPYLLNYTFYNITHQYDSQQDTTAPLELSDTVDTSELNSSSYYVNFTCSDSHTSQSIQEYDIVKDLLNNKITFNKEISIKMYSNDVGFSVEDIAATKLMDRYNFDFGGSVNKGTYYFEIKSNYPLYEVKNSGYRGHFVTGKYWLDFNNDDAKAIYDIIKIDKYTYRIGITTTSLNFNSIGELNTVKEFYIVNIDNENPGANCSSPIDNYSFNTSATGNFVCNATDNYLLDSLAFWTNHTGTWHQEDIDNTITGTSGQHTFGLSISGNNTVAWGCYACDSFSQCTFSLNRTYTSNITLVGNETNAGSFGVGVCPDTIAGSMMFFVMIIIALTLIILGVAFKVGSIGLFGAIMLIISSWYIAGCVSIFGTTLALGSFVMIIYFALVGLGFVD
jgi:hypothetical protein